MKTCVKALLFATTMLLNTTVTAGLPAQVSPEEKRAIEFDVYCYYYADGLTDMYPMVENIQWVYEFYHTKKVIADQKNVLTKTEKRYLQADARGKLNNPKFLNSKCLTTFDKETKEKGWK